MLRTPNLQLPQWETNDIISYLGEWNSAMDKIDDGFGAVQAVANSAQSTASTASTNATNALNLANDLSDDVTALQSTVTTQGNTINTHTAQIGTLNTNVGGITAKIGTTDISDMGDGTITGALQSLEGNAIERSITSVGNGITIERYGKLRIITFDSHDFSTGYVFPIGDRPTNTVLIDGNTTGVGGVNVQTAIVRLLANGTMAGYEIALYNQAGGGASTITGGRYLNGQAIFTVA